MEQEKERYALWMNSSSMDVVKELYRSDNCKSRSEFIEKAVLFYAGYLHTKRAANFLPRVLADIINGALGSLGDRMGRLLFKQAVEINILNHIIAADSDMDTATYERLRNRSVREVRLSNGEISLKDDILFQKTV